VGCTISIGTRNGRAVIVKPDRINPGSADQVCVRGRFHYDAVSDKQRLGKHLVRRGPAGTPQFPAHWGELIEHVATQVKDVIAKHGAESVAVLGSPFNTNEENYLAQKLARDVIGTPHVDFSGGAPDRAAAEAIEAAFGTSALPADMSRLGESDLTIVIADDLESSHNVAALRTKDGVVGNPLEPRDGRLVLISHMWGELADFTEPYGGTWLQPQPGFEPAVADALAKRFAGGSADVPALAAGDLGAAIAALERAKDANATVTVLYAVPRFDARAAAEGAKAAANLALALPTSSAGIRLSN
jgi:formate dehydrogenase major subunit